MIKIIFIFNFLISIFTLTTLNADNLEKNDTETYRGFTVTSIALDAQNERLQLEEDSNETTIEGGVTEEKMF